MLLRSKDAIVGYVTGEAKELPLRPDSDRRIKLESHGAQDHLGRRLLAYRELDNPRLTEIAITKLLEGRRGKNARHTLGGLFRQSVFGRLARLRSRHAGDRRP